MHIISNNQYIFYWRKTRWTYQMLTAIFFSIGIFLYWSILFKRTGCKCTIVQEILRKWQNLMKIAKFEVISFYFMTFSTSPSDAIGRKCSKINFFGKSYIQISKAKFWSVSSFYIIFSTNDRTQSTVQHVSTYLSKISPNKNKWKFWMFYFYCMMYSSTGRS